MARIAAEQRTLLLKDLTCVVRYRRTSGNHGLGWRTLAAFDVFSVAERYAADCQRANGEEYVYEAIDLEEK